MRLFKGLDLDRLQELMAEMNQRQPLYQLIRTELKKRGNWKDKPRGKYGNARQ